MPTLSVASASGNNCLLHCFIHVLFNLSAEKNDRVAQTSGYQKLLIHFQEYYGLDERPSREGIEKLNNDFPHPLEREVIWGPVFRKFLISVLDLQVDNDQAEIDDLKKGGTIPDEYFSKVVNLFNFNMIAANSYRDIADPIEYGLEDQSLVISTLKVVHNRNHYNFEFSDDQGDAKANAHHEQMSRLDEHDRHDLSGTQFGDFFTINRANMRKDYIMHVVKQKLLAEPDERVGLQPVNDEQLSDERAALDDEIDLKVLSEDAASLPTDPETGFPVAFIEQLSTLFPKDADWIVEKVNGQIMATNGEKAVKMTLEQDYVSFSGRSNSIADIINAASAYSKVVDQDVEYELEVGSKEEALEFLSKLKGSNIALKAITDIKIDEIELTSDEIIALFAEMEPGFKAKLDQDGDEASLDQDRGEPSRKIQSKYSKY